MATVAMWWIYFNIAAERASHLIAHHADPGRAARLAYTIFPLPIVAGITSVSAAGDEMALAHPVEHVGGELLAANLGGAALFLIGNLFFKRGNMGPLALLALRRPGIVFRAWFARTCPLHSGMAVSLLDQRHAHSRGGSLETRSLRGGLQRGACVSSRQSIPHHRTAFRGEAIRM